MLKDPVFRWRTQIESIPIIGPLVWILVSYFSCFIVFRSHNDHSNPLFPSMGHVINEKDGETCQNNSETPETPETSLPNPSNQPVPCSTGISTRLLPFKNDKGEIEWAFSEELPPGSELDAFKVTHAPPLKHETAEPSLSPVTSNESLQLNDKRSAALVNTPSSTASDDEKQSARDGDEVHQCPHCSTTFKMRGYLTRHLKKHASQKAYRCPFHETTVFKDENDVTHKCHPNGGFSRRDTYKTHLKSRHFRYPKGTSIRDRCSSPGNCSMCGEWFENGEIWCEIHVEGGECKYLPSGFRGKSRIKNRLKKQLAKMAKEQKQMMKKTGSIPPSAVPDHQSSMTPTLSTPNSINTPITSATSSFEHHNSPTFSTASSVSAYVHPSQHQPQSQPQHQQHQPQHQPQHHQEPLQPQYNQTYLHDVGVMTDKHEPEGTLVDYDDDFCLDLEQMGYPPINQDLLYQQYNMAQGPYTGQYQMAQMPVQMGYNGMVPPY